MYFALDSDDFDPDDEVTEFLGIEPYCHDLASDLYKTQNPILNTEELNKGVDGLYTHFRSRWSSGHFVRK